MTCPIGWMVGQCMSLPVKRRAGRPGLAPDVIAEILRLRDEGILSQQAIASRLNCTWAQVRYVLNKTTHPRPGQGQGETA